MVGYDTDNFEDGRSKLLRNVCNKLSIDTADMPEDLNLHIAECCRKRRFENLEIPSSDQFLSSQLPLSLLSLSYPILSSLQSVRTSTTSYFPSILSYPIVTNISSHLHIFTTPSVPSIFILSYLILTLISSYFHNFLFPFDPFDPCRFTAENDPTPIVQEAGLAPEAFWTGAENLVPAGIRPPNHPVSSKSLY